jgi:tRNA(His) 5'-end guanylyltransferase
MEGQTMSKDPMGDRMKMFEATATSMRAHPELPLCVRLDGRAFSTYTRGLDRPFDRRMITAMVETATHLTRAFKPCIAYTQSDEISLVFAPRGEFVFGGKLHKINSVFAGVASVVFYQAILPHLPLGHKGYPAFDCRTWSVPSGVEAANVVLWRWFDAKKNSISALAQAHFSHKVLHGKHEGDQLAMLEEKGIHWSDLPEDEKWGTFLRRKVVERLLTEEELERIPEKHRPTGPVMRTVVEAIEMPPFNRVSNRLEVVFDGAAPEVMEESDGQETEAAQDH